VKHTATAGLLLAAALLAGCAGLAPEKRHSPAEIASYSPAHFSAPIASREGARLARDKALAAIRQAQAPGADDQLVQQALWAVAFHDTEHAAGRTLLQRALGPGAPPLAQRSVEQQRAVLSAAHMLDATGTAPLIRPVIEQLATPREFAIAAYTLLRADTGTAQRDALRNVLARRSDRDDPRLRALAQALDAPVEAPNSPPLVDLLAAPFAPGLPVVYSLQRRDRRHIGLALVRGADGRFVRQADGSVFHIPHLALALTGLPGTITNGNTPQGLFTVVGAGTATNAWIGPTPYLESKVPVEASLAEFAHAPAEGDWTEARYEAWLPPSWRKHAPFKEAWLAGLAGRSEMLLHGTTIDAQPYRDRPWYPGTPSAGCLVALETWSPEDGRGLRSDQLSLVQAFTRGGLDRGYLVVVDIDDRPGPVLWADVAADIARAESRMAAAR